MQVIDSKTYNVMDGEPHLGKQIETTIEVSRDEYLEAMVEAILDGAESTEDVFTVDDGEYEQEYTLGCDLTQDNIDRIIREINFNLLDDDFGSGRDYDLVYDLLDEFIDEDWTDEFLVVEMRGY